MRRALVLLAVAACGDKPAPPPVDAAPPPPPPVDAAPPTPPAPCWRPGPGLQLTDDDKPLRIGVVADARSVDPAVYELALEQIGDVDILVSLGGHAGDPAPALTALAAPGRPLVALPGDREDAQAHAAAVARLASSGLPVHDGATLGPLTVAGTTLLFVPGLPVSDEGRFHGLLAGSKGCGRTAAELAALAIPDTSFVVFAHEPPRQRGAAGTDLALGGVHAGEPALAALAAEAILFVHAGLDEAAGRISGKDPMIAASGSISPNPGQRLDGDRPRASALVVEISGDRARVRSLTWPAAR